MSNRRKKLGAEGEQLAKKLLLSKGYRFLAQNFTTKFGEIDLIFLDEEMLVFTEVKSRKGSEKGRPDEAVTPYKLKQIMRVANYFMQSNESLPSHGRIDVVTVEFSTTPP